MWTFLYRNKRRATKMRCLTISIAFSLFFLFGAFTFSYVQHVQQTAIENELLREANFLIVYLFHDIYTLKQSDIIGVQTNHDSIPTYSYIELTSDEKIGFSSATILSTLGEIHIENKQIELLPTYSITPKSSTLYEITFTLQHKRTNISVTFTNEIPIITTNNQK